MQSKHILPLALAAVFTLGTMSFAYAQSQQPGQVRDQKQSEYQEQLDEIERDFDELGEKAKQSGKRGEQEWNQFKRSVDEQTDKLRQQIDELGERTEENWDDLTRNIDQGMDGLKRLYEQAKQRWKT